LTPTMGPLADGGVVESLPIADTEQVRMLAGPGQSHLTVMEDLLSVRLEAPGGMVTIAGDEPDRSRAKRVILRLLKQLEAGETIGEGEVRAAIRFEREAATSEATESIIRIDGRVSFRARTPNQGRYIDLLEQTGLGLVFGVGPAGTGKTLLAVAQGARLLSMRAVDRLVITRPAVEAGERLGFLPGDLEDKVDPYMLPIWDALRDSLGARNLERYREQAQIEVAPIAFMRGRTLRNAFVIVDEAQNATVAQMQMVLTRIGEGTRMVVTGDPSQVDLPNHQRSGLMHALELLHDVEGVGHILFERADVVRHALVGRIVAAYEADTARRGR
jgi:phosphate starvation-inducible protein PhoH and related proteins